MWNPRRLETWAHEHGQICTELTLLYWAFDGLALLALACEGLLQRSRSYVLSGPGSPGFALTSQDKPGLVRLCLIEAGVMALDLIGP